MSEDRSSIDTGDLTLDEETAEGVVGGAHAHRHLRRMTMAEAEKAGYHEVECLKGGGTLMKNGHGQEAIVP
jgi:hypothetical protein